MQRRAPSSVSLAIFSLALGALSPEAWACPPPPRTDLAVAQAGIAGRIAGVLSWSKASYPRPRSNDEDSSHDNLRYVLRKNAELIHGLSHLQIDPDFLEGQIFQIWRLLELLHGFPHLPLPDGLAFVDYDVGAARSLVRSWANEFGIELSVVPGPEATPRETQVKEVAKRLMLAHSLVEEAYNSGLVLGHDLSMTAYYFIRFVMEAKTTVDIIARHFSGVPIVGPVARLVRRLIVGKLLRVVDDLAWVVGVRLRSPYNYILLILVQLVSDAISRSMNVAPDPIMYPGRKKEYFIGLLGKYLLTSLPRIGYTARGQRAVDTAAQLATALTAVGTFQEAYDRVWDDGYPGTYTSVREQIYVEIVQRHNRALTQQQIGWITGRLADVARYATLIDPTSFSRVAAIVLTVVTASVYASAAHTTGGYFFSLPRTAALDGVRKSFDPGAQDLSGEDDPGIRSAPPDRAALARVAADLEEAVADYLSAARQVAQPAVGAAIGDAWERLSAADENLDAISSEAHAVVYSAAAGERRILDDSDIEGFYSRVQEFNGLRMKLPSDLLARTLDPQNTVRLSSEFAPALSSYVEAVRARLARLSGQDQLAIPLVVTRAKARVFGPEFVIEATVKNKGTQPLGGVTVRLVSGLSFEIVGEAQPWLGTLRPGDSRKCSFRIRLMEPRPMSYQTVAVVPQAEGAVPLARTVLLER